MFQSIQEPVSVAGVYQTGQFHPRKFLWHEREYPVQEVTLRSDLRDGGVRKRIYSVMAGGNLYRLCFNRDDELWILEEVWCE